MSQREALGRVLREARLAANLTQAACARCVGVHPSHWANVETGQSGTSIEVLIRAAALLQLDLGDLQLLQPPPEDP